MVIPPAAAAAAEAMVSRCSAPGSPRLARRSTRPGARQLPPAGTLDALAPGLVVGLMVVSLADFLAGPGYGSETTLFWAIDLFGVRRHPVQLYESLTMLLFLGVLLILKSTFLFLVCTYTYWCNLFLIQILNLLILIENQILLKHS